MEETLELGLDFKTDTDAGVIFFGQIVITRTEKVPAYDPVAPLVEAVKVALAAFIKAASDAMNGGEELIALRDQKRNDFNIALENLGMGLILENSDPVYVTNAGFTVRKKSGAQSRQPFVAPVFKSLTRGTLRGTVKGEVKSLPKGAYGVIPSWRIKDDLKPDFTDGKPSTGKRFELSGLPTLKEIETAVRFYGTHNRQSDPCKPMAIDVI